MACDPSLADTAQFCDHYGIDPADSANTIVVVSKKPAGVMAACVVLATTRLDVNHTVRHRLGVRKLSFAGADETVALTGMMIGGVTPFGLPADLPLLVDGAVMGRERIVLGGGNRSTKLIMPPAGLTSLPNATVIDGLASAV
jgi:prolyl-tRNA editing enzyme YbaK/EbsC (Cys-tRNA(Pro) deacylase)